LRIFYANPAKQLRRQKQKGNNLFSDFFSILALTLSNPMAVFLFLALFAGLGLVDEQGGMFSTLQIVVGVFSGAAAWWFTLSTLVNIFREKFRLRRLWWINKIAGVAIFLFGVFAIVGMLFIK
jgi:threonine/homoserine/homoserine lactone efflux protein